MKKNKKSTPFSEAFSVFKPALFSTVVFSFFISLLMFVGPLYMLQVYDRVLSSRSVSTLIALTGIAIGMLVILALLDFIRSRVLVRAGLNFDKNLNSPLFRAALTKSLYLRNTNSVAILRDMDNLRAFCTGPGILALCDAPFTPLFIIVCYLFHPLLGLVALIGTVFLFLLALVNEFATRYSLEASGQKSAESSHYATTSLRNAEVIQALGMQGAIHKRWADRRKEMLGWQAFASDRAGAIMSLSKFIRQCLQIAILGTGAWLAIRREISPGVMIAASIMMGRALAPVEQAVGHWKGLVAARTAYGRLAELFTQIPVQPERTPLPDPKGAINVEQLVTVAPGAQEPILKGVSFAINSGEVLAIIGPSAAGKSVLARALVGVWPAVKGHVRLDGADIRHWEPEALGIHMGYLPQDIELFSGTVAENIARFRDDDPELAVEAAKLARVHDLIQKLPNGYDTQIGEGGSVLSGGQRQRIGLARAIYGNPVYLVLDEPNSNLDKVGEEDLAKALVDYRKNGGTVVVITHKPNLLSAADKILVLKDGAVGDFGPAKDVMARLMGKKAPLGGQQVPSPSKLAPGTTMDAKPNTKSDSKTAHQTNGAGSAPKKMGTPQSAMVPFGSIVNWQDGASAKPDKNTVTSASSESQNFDAQADNDDRLDGKNKKKKKKKKQKSDNEKPDGQYGAKAKYAKKPAAAAKSDKQFDLK